MAFRHLAMRLAALASIVWMGCNGSSTAQPGSRDGGPGSTSGGAGGSAGSVNSAGGTGAAGTAGLRGASPGGAGAGGTAEGGTQTLNCAPAAADTMTNTVSHLCGLPDTTNTGVPPGTALKRVPQDITSPDATTGSGWHWDTRGWLAVDTQGGIVQDVVVSGDVEVMATDVTVQHVKIDGGFDGFGVGLRHADNAVVQDNEIHGADTGSGRLMTGIKDVYGDSQNVKMLRTSTTQKPAFEPDKA